MSETIQVHRGTHYIAVPGDICRDVKRRGITAKMIGLYTYIYNLPEDDWNFSVSGLACRMSEGEDAIRSILNDLRNAGYVTMQQDKDERGRFRRTKWDIYDKPVKTEARTPKTPHRDFPHTDKPDADKPHAENPTQCISFINDNNNIGACDVRACEEDFHREMLANESAIEALCMRHHTDKENLQKKAEEFRLHCIAGAVTHESEQDYQKHFRDWLNINLQSNEKTTASNISRDEQRRQESEARKSAIARRIAERLAIGGGD